MIRLLILGILLLGSASFGRSAVALQETPSAATCDAPEFPPGTPSPPKENVAPDASPTIRTGTITASPQTDQGMMADAATEERVFDGIRNFVACRNAGDFAAYAALLTSSRMVAEVGTSNPYDVVADLDAFNLPITILSLENAMVFPDGRLSANFVHPFGSHLYYRSRVYVAEDEGFIKFDEER